MRWMTGVAVLPLVMVAACGDSGTSGGSASSRDRVHAVGSSTVYPFATATAEQYAASAPGAKSPTIEATGTGAGMKQFCAGVGTRYPDIANASRRMKRSEYDDCAKNGVKDVIEVQIGIDGVVFAEAKNGPALKLTVADAYKALAAEPFGKPNTAKTWADVNPALPAVPIQVYGPPSTSGTRDALVELVMDKGCDSDPATKALKETDEDRHKAICTTIRSDGAYIDSGENDNLIVQKLASNPNAVGIFGWSFLEENQATMQGVPFAGVAPSYETISNYTYPGARPLFIYVKSAHLNAVPGLREYVQTYPKGWGPDGFLARRGLVAAPADVRTRNEAVITGMTPLDPAALK